MAKKTFGTTVKIMREDRGYSMRAFAIAIGMDPSNWHKIENDIKTAPNQSKLDDIADVLELGSLTRRVIFKLAKESWIQSKMK